MEDETIYSQLTEIFRNVLMQDDLELHPELTADDVENWSSLKAIEIMVAVEMHFGIKISSRQLGKLKSVGNFVEIIKDAKGS